MEVRRFGVERNLWKLRATSAVVLPHARGSAVAEYRKCLRYAVAGVHKPRYRGRWSPARPGPARPGPAQPSASMQNRTGNILAGRELPHRVCLELLYIMDVQVHGPSAGDPVLTLCFTCARVQGGGNIAAAVRWIGSLQEFSESPQPKYI